LSAHFLDARRLLCPLPVIRVQDQVNALSDGEVIDVVCTDPGTLSDIPAWCRINRHTLLNTRRDGLDIFFTIKVGDAPSGQVPDIS
jgi:TusA-related sulfurtransferase